MSDWSPEVIEACERPLIRAGTYHDKIVAVLDAAVAFRREDGTPEVVRAADVWTTEMATVRALRERAEAAEAEVFRLTEQRDRINATAGVVGTAYSELEAERDALRDALRRVSDALCSSSHYARKEAIDIIARALTENGETSNPGGLA